MAIVDFQAVLNETRAWTALMMRLAGVVDSIVSDVLGHEHKGATNKIYAAVMRKARTINSLGRMSDDELRSLREFLTPAVETVKLPTAKVSEEEEAEG